MIFKNKLFKLLLLVPVVGLFSCQKMERPALGDYPQDHTTTPTTPLRFYTNFDSTKPADQQINIRFKDSISEYPSFFPSNDIKVGAGVRGTTSFLGASGTALNYINANDWNKSTSFTIAFWEKNTVPTGGSPQWLFTLPSHDFWHQSAITAFVDHDGAGSTSSLATVKIILQDQWLEFTNANRMPGNILDNQWHHLAFVYDEATSKMSYYVDGQLLTGLPASITDVLKNGNPRGPMDFANTYNFIIGGWTKHVNLGGVTDSWVEAWKGGMDQFRLYNKALSAAEINTLYTSQL